MRIGHYNKLDRKISKNKPRSEDSLKKPARIINKVQVKD